MSRDISIRKIKQDITSILLPLSYINPHYGFSINSIIRDLHTTPKVFLKPDVFPHNIQEYYWIQEGVSGNKSWYALGLLENNIYFLYRAYTHTSFERDGHMDLWLSYNFADLIQHAMDNTVYTKYITDIITFNNNTSDTRLPEPEVK